MITLLGALAGERPWTAEELAILREAYASGGISTARAALPGRSRCAIYHRSERMGVLRRRRWTSDDDDRLRRLWSVELGLREISKRLGRTQITTYWRAQRLGLPLGCPDGWEYLSAAAQRTGYDPATLRMILRAADVEIYRAITRPGAPRGERRWRPTHVVNPGDVDVAVARWLETEPLERAARRLGMCAETLARRLYAIGVTKTTGKKAHWRVSAEDVERAMEAA